MTTTTKSGFYGFDWGTYYVTATGRIWLIQSDDRDDLPVEVSELPDGGEWLDESVCADMDISGCEDRCGTLCDYDTTEPIIRPATADEQRASREAAERDGGAGVIDVDGRRCYVED